MTAHHFTISFLITSIRMYLIRHWWYTEYFYHNSHH